MNGKDLEGENIEIVFAKPPDQKRKERKAQRQAAKNQMWVKNEYSKEKLYAYNFGIIYVTETSNLWTPFKNNLNWELCITNGKDLIVY